MTKREKTLLELHAADVNERGPWSIEIICPRCHYPRLVFRDIGEDFPNAVTCFNARCKKTIYPDDPRDQYEPDKDL